MNRYGCFALLCFYASLCFATLCSPESIQEHSIIKPIPKSVLDHISEYRDYVYELPFYDKTDDIINYKTVKGAFLKLGYKIFGKNAQSSNGIYSSLEIIRTYRNFAIEKGGKILWERASGDRLAFTIPKTDGENIWCQVFARNGYYELDILEEEKGVSSAKKMKENLDIDGQIIFHSIPFDFGESRIKKESIKTLKEIVELMKTYPELKIEIQGHTDSRGSDQYNQVLSQKRAEAVRVYLIGQGVDASRMTANGFGASKPLEPNDSKEGRGKNRRVVIVKK